jgi:DNA-binding SARP family transcriptional activator
MPLETDIRFGLLGPLTVRHGQTEVHVSGARQRTVLAALLLSANKIIEAAELADKVWDGAPPAAGLTTLRSYVMRVRRAIGPVLARRVMTCPPGYLISLNHDSELDIKRYATLCEHGRAAGRSGHWEKSAHYLREAIGLWRGRPLIDIPSDRLLSEHVAVLEESRLQALEWRIGADLHLGRHEDVLVELAGLVKAHPLREHLHACQIRALYHSGRESEALAAFHDARRLLMAELQVSPGAELLKLYHQILNREAVPAGARPPAITIGRVFASPCQLPVDLADYTGRDELVSYLTGIFAATADCSPGQGAKIVALVGMGGMGKTALAVHAAHLGRQHFPDGQLYAHLRGSSASPVEPTEVLARFLRDLGIGPESVPEGADERAAVYRGQLSDRRMLVMLDDARDIAQVRQLLPGGPGCAALITSRGSMFGLESSRTVELGPMNEPETRKLFTRIVGPRRASLEPEPVARLLGFCAGLPLAVRVAACRLASRPAWSVGTLLNRLVGQHDCLGELHVGDLSVREAFAVSYGNLPGPDARSSLNPARTFRMLALAAGSDISVPAAAALLAQPAEVTEQELELLVDLHLLESPCVSRYRFHDLLRIYARGCAFDEEDPGALRDAIRALHTWYLGTAQAAVQVISSSGPQAGVGGRPTGGEPPTFADRNQALAWAQAEQANLAACLQQAARLGSPGTARRLQAVLRQPYGRHGAQAMPARVDIARPATQWRQPPHSRRGEPPTLPVSP